MSLADRPAAVLFDCDGVIADTEALHDRLLAEAVSALGWEITAAEAAQRFRGLAWAAIGPEVEQRLGPGSLPADFLPDLIARVVRALEDEVVAIPGAPEAIAAIVAAGIPIAVASNSSHAELSTKLRRLGLAETFRGRAFSVNDVARPKPAPDLYLVAAASCGADPNRSVVVEDSFAGARAGIAAGCRVLGYARHTDKARLRCIGAEPFDDMRELAALLGLTTAPAGLSGAAAEALEPACATAAASESFRGAAARRDAGAPHPDGVALRRRSAEASDSNRPDDPR